ncbi:hypothetical protein AB205_0039080 [Aquarana catesbeiana]|uniref:Uncharacterized protein n=1 Tax=Aquarana catesbeiana TaxID=8400 RepID=A0A2G9Q501_AQUCT|nr:hypothetical protein AB205_0039080 [Aquarana catesbeiana]
MCSVIQSEGEIQEEEPEAATPTSTEAEQEVEETCPVEAAGDAEEQPDATDPGSKHNLFCIFQANIVF